MNRATVALFGCVLAAAAVPAGASNTPTYSFLVQGSWSNPVLAGNVIDAKTGTPTFTDNSTTAACDVSGCPNGVGNYGADTLVWGNNPDSSSVNINGHFIFDEPLNTVFDAAEITYFNGTSALDSIIFGATLTLRFEAPFGESGPDIASPFSVPMNIVTTSNTGNAFQNADWIGPFGTASPMTFNVLEGEDAHAELYGMLVDDPQFQPTLLLSTDANGFIGNGSVPGGVPEPATWAMMLLGFGAAGGALRRVKKLQGITQPA